MKKARLLLLITLSVLFVSCASTSQRDPANDEVKDAQRKHFQWNDRFNAGNR